MDEQAIPAQAGPVMTDPLVEDYLRRLDVAARVLPEDRRRELVDEIAAHIAQSRAGGAGAGEADLRTLLERLGDPQEIVAAAREEDPSAYPAFPAAGGYGPQVGADGRGRRPGLGIEIAAVLLLTVGSIIPVIGWAAGVVLLWMSRRWRTGEKILATLVFPGGPGLALIVGTLGTGSTNCTSSTSSSAGGGSTTVSEHCGHSGLPVAVGFALFLVWVLAPIVIGVVLLVRARNRAEVEPPLELR